jgi:hypothetical protein
MYFDDKHKRDVNSYCTTKTLEALLFANDPTLRALGLYVLHATHDRPVEEIATFHQRWDYRTQACMCAEKWKVLI